ncbi:hypothetical protein [Sphingomonas antarctica]|uniref:hypothetical protein n=1 Tax=Sphingomonas antarctica TaxID=2040274 RepID=UPI0039E80F64
MKSFILAVAAAALCATTVAAREKPIDRDDPNSLTHGMAQMTLHVGQTTQLDVAEAFGAPNITTLDAQGQEVWIYDRHDLTPNLHPVTIRVSALLLRMSAG